MFARLLAELAHERILPAYSKPIKMRSLAAWALALASVPALVADGAAPNTNTAPKAECAEHPPLISKLPGTMHVQASHFPHSLGFEFS